MEERERKKNEESKDKRLKCIIREDGTVCKNIWVRVHIYVGGCVSAWSFYVTENGGSGTRVCVLLRPAYANYSPRLMHT